MKLTEYDKHEWLDVARLFKPDLTEAEYERMWNEFVAFKAAHYKRLATQ